MAEQAINIYNWLFGGKDIEYDELIYTRETVRISEEISLGKSGLIKNRMRERIKIEKENEYNTFNNAAPFDASKVSDEEWYILEEFIATMEMCDDYITSPHKCTNQS